MQIKIHRGVNQIGGCVTEIKSKKAKLKKIRIHDFRHSCASLLINNGANVTIVAKYL